MIICRVHFGAELLRHLRGIDPVLLGVNLKQRTMRVDPFVKQRLRDGGIVNLAVSVAAIADQVDDNVAAKL